MLALGIDPGFGRLGWGIVKKESSALSLVDYGCFETPPNLCIEDRLTKVFTFIDQTIKSYHPVEAAIEDLFFAKNAKTAMNVGAARGVAIVACTTNNLSVFSYTPLQIKSSLTGFGRADKKQVQFMVERMLSVKKHLLQDDAIDAVAIAITHLTQNRVLK